MDLEKLANILDMLGSIWTLFSFLASVFTFIRIHEQRAVGRTRVTPYLFMLISVVMGAYTAILELNYVELQTSLVGCILEMAYISIYLYYAPNARIRALRILGSLITLFVIEVIWISNLATTKSKVAAAKLISTIFSIIILVLPLPTVIEAVRTRTLDMITPFWLSLTLTLSYTITFTYEMLGTHLSIIYASEICGIILGIIQMVLYYVIRSQQISTSLQQNPPAPIIPQQNPPALVPHQQDPQEGQIIVNIESLDGVGSQSNEQEIIIMNTEAVDEVGSAPESQEITEDQQYGFIERDTGFGSSRDLRIQI